MRRSRVRVDDLRKACLVDGERLLDEHMLAGAQRFRGHRGVLMVPGGDEHGIDAGRGQHLAIVGGAIGRIVFARNRQRGQPLPRRQRILERDARHGLEARQQDSLGDCRRR